MPPDRLFWRVAWTETHARRSKTQVTRSLRRDGYTPSSDKSAAGDGSTSISFWLYMLLALFTLLLLACCAAES
uniref:Uncharacterized protein n=1 Tax=Globodera pallida TaxID=36090 RepID=A0A183CFH1_GLOPA